MNASLDPLLFPALAGRVEERARARASTQQEETMLRTTRRKFLSVTAAIGLGVLTQVTFAPQALAQKQQFLALSTSSVGGTWYPLATDERFRNHRCLAA